MTWGDDGLTFILGSTSFHIFPATIAVFLIALVAFVGVAIFILRRPAKDDIPRSPWSQRKRSRSTGRLRPVHAVIALLFAFAVWQIYESQRAAPPLSSNSTLRGVVTHVRDGDTIEVGNTPVRLNGVAAPEMDEVGGRAGRRFMSRLVAGKQVRCDLNGDVSYDRVIGTCFLDGQDIGAAIISAGLARDCPRFSGGRYRRFNTERSAQLPLPRYCR